MLRCFQPYLRVKGIEKIYARFANNTFPSDTVIINSNIEMR